MNQSKSFLYEHPMQNLQAVSSEGGTVALYRRLSSEDGRDGDSYSIINQEKLLKQRAKELGFEKVKVYTDDGITGTTFDRKGFNSMLEDIRKGVVNAVIVKDLSRFGRNTSEILYYVELVFPEHGVRFISLNENIDSINGTPDILPFLSVLAEQYAKDISKKVRSVKYMKGNSGEPIGLPPYGYIRKSIEENSWIIDEEAAAVVRRIYAMYLGGCGTHQIARILTDERILTPMEYWKSKGIGRGGKKRKETLPYSWGNNSVATILDNQRYCGDVINFLTYKPSYKSKKTVNVPKEHQKIFKDVHEPIIPRDEFEKVQALRITRNRKRQKSDGSHNMFAGLLYCSECGNKLHQHRYSKTDEEYFNCSNYRGNLLRGTCETTHHIRMDYLSQVVLFEITKLIHFSKIYTDDV